MPVIIDPAHLEAHLKADADVIRSLRGNGDIPSIVRPVDVRFKGEREKIIRLGQEIEKSKWRVVQIVSHGEMTAIDLQRDQTTEEAAIRQLTEMALQVEIEWDVEYDGWGTVAKNRH